MPSLRLFIFEEWCTVNGSGTLVFSFISTLEFTQSWFLLKFQVYLTSIPVHKFLDPYCIIRNPAFLNTWSFTFLISKLSNLLQIRDGKVNTTRPGFKTWKILNFLFLQIFMKNNEKLHLQITNAQVHRNEEIGDTLRVVTVTVTNAIPVNNTTSLPSTGIHIQYSSHRLKVQIFTRRFFVYSLRFSLPIGCSWNTSSRGIW